MRFRDLLYLSCNSDCKLKSQDLKAETLVTVSLEPHSPAFPIYPIFSSQMSVMEETPLLTEENMKDSHESLPNNLIHQVCPSIQLPSTHQEPIPDTQQPSLTDLLSDSRYPSNVVQGGIASRVVAVEFSAKYGRYLVVTRDVQAGEMLLQEAPLLVVPKVGTEPFCLCCLVPLQQKWIGCRRCGGPLCSFECSGKHHGFKECEVLRRMGLKQAPHIDALIKELNLILGPLRLFLQIQESSVAQKVFMCLESHAAQRCKLAVGRFVEENIAGSLRQRLGLDMAPDVVQRLCGVLDTNCYELTMNNGGHCRALFPVAAMINHSCVPNAHWWFSQGRISVQAAEDISQGCPVLINYTHTLWGTRARSIQLTTCKMFTCKCQRCLDPTELGTHLSSLHCLSCKGGMMVPPVDSCHDWVCQSCGNTLRDATVEAMVGAAATTLTRLKTEDVTTVAAIISHLRRMLGPQHYMVLQAHYCHLEIVFSRSLTGKCNCQSTCIVCFRLCLKITG